MELRVDIEQKFYAMVKHEDDFYESKRDAAFSDIGMKDRVG
ncbi:hypothetical protein P3S34_25450 [Enterobacter hormaechei]|nr:hypothetical protein [Enterobacter hormaechei]MDF3613450.1 hypothetical protein [Enterobacter hormaechei]